MKQAAMVLVITAMMGCIFGETGNALKKPVIDTQVHLLY